MKVSPCSFSILEGGTGEEDTLLKKEKMLKVLVDWLVKCVTVMATAVVFTSTKTIERYVITTIAIV